MKTAESIEQQDERKKARGDEATRFQPGNPGGPGRPPMDPSTLKTKLRIQKLSGTGKEPAVRKQKRDEAKAAAVLPDYVPQPKMLPKDASRIKPWQWKPGQSGNPGGKPKVDYAAEIARAAFENNPDALYKAYCKALLKGNAYAFKELSDRAYGKMTERIEHELTQYRSTSEHDLVERNNQLEQQLNQLETGTITSQEQDPRGTVSDTPGTGTTQGPKTN